MNKIVVNKEYNPHITIAYVKSGKGEKYKRKFDKKMSLKPKYFSFSSPNYQKVEFKK